MPQEAIYVLMSEKNTRNEYQAISNMLVNPLYRDTYDELNRDMEEKKDKQLSALQKQSKLIKKNIENQVNTIIDDDAQLSRIRKNLAKNAQIQALTGYIEVSHQQKLSFLLKSSDQKFNNNSVKHFGFFTFTIVMSIAIRMKAEQFMTERIRLKKNDTGYWCQKKNQFAKLYDELITLDAKLPERSILDKVNVTVSSNIHLNSFMYEPILDLSIESLVQLYNEVKALKP